MEAGSSGAAGNTPEASPFAAFDDTTNRQLHGLQSAHSKVWPDDVGSSCGAAGPASRAGSSAAVPPSAPSQPLLRRVIYRAAVPAEAADFAEVKDLRMLTADRFCVPPASVVLTDHAGGSLLDDLPLTDLTDKQRFLITIVEALGTAKTWEAWLEPSEPGGDAGDAGAASLPLSASSSAALSSSAAPEPSPPALPAVAPDTDAQPSHKRRRLDEAGDDDVHYVARSPHGTAVEIFDPSDLVASGVGAGSGGSDAAEAGAAGAANYDSEDEDDIFGSNGVSNESPAAGDNADVAPSLLAQPGAVDEDVEREEEGLPPAAQPDAPADEEDDSVIVVEDDDEDDEGPTSIITDSDYPTATGNVAADLAAAHACNAAGPQ